MRRGTCWGVLAALLAGAGCAPEKGTSFGVPVTVARKEGDPLPATADPWILSTSRTEREPEGVRAQPDPAQLGPYLGNGRLGQRVDAAGGLVAGKSQPAFMAGHYRDEALAPLPTVFPLALAAGGRRFGQDRTSIHEYHQELRLRHGLLVTRGLWSPGLGEIEVGVAAAILRHRPDCSLIRLTINNRSSGPALIGVPEDCLPGVRLGGKPGLVHFGSAGVNGTALLTVLDRADLVVEAGSEGLASQVGVPAGEKAVVLLTVRLRKGPRPPALEVARTSVAASREIASHEAAWEKLWKSDIEIVGDDEAQLAVRACLYQLLCAVRPGEGSGIPPMGFSANAFQGHVFWDMDSWILPAMLPQHPDAARGMLDYRLQTLPGARANARAEGLSGASYAWESGASGRETLLHEVFRHGRHVSGDVALAVGMARAASVDADFDARYWPIVKETADNWVARARPDGKGGFVIKGVTTPDENAGKVDHSAWTHHVARVNLDLAEAMARARGFAVNPKWRTVSRGLSFLRDDTGLLLAYQGFKPTTKAKQADAVLLTFPGEASLPEADQRRLYEFYSPRVIANGPAMTEAVHAIAAARLDLGDAALAHFQQSFRPFMRPPFLVFSEKRTRDNLCFLTGCAGVVEAVLYGFCGLEYRNSPPADRPVAKPHLPPGWARITVRRLQWRGRYWDLQLQPGQKPRWLKASG